MSLVNSCKRKLEDYPPDVVVDDSTSSRMKTDVINTSVNSSTGELSSRVLTAASSKSTDCSAESSRSNSGLQFLVKLFSGMETIVIRADVNDTVEFVHQVIRLKTGIPMEEQRLIYKSKQLYGEQKLGEFSIENDAVLQLVGVMRSTIYPKAQQLVDQIVSLVWRLCKGNSENRAWNREARNVIKRNLSDYFSMLPRNDLDKAIGHLLVFLHSGAPAAFAMLFMCPDKRIYGDELIQELITLISVIPQYLFQQCVPILLEICKSLRGIPLYDNYVIFDMCRSCLSTMVGCIKIGTESNGRGSTNLVTAQDMLAFVGEAADKISSNMHGGIEWNTRILGPFPLMREILYLKTFMMPIKKLVMEEFLFWCHVSRNGFDISRYKEEFKVLHDSFFSLLEKLDACLAAMEVLLPTESESLGCYQYLAILMELNTMSKLYPDLRNIFRTTLMDRKLSFCYLIIKYARRVDDYGWISEHKEVTNFECRRHLAMLLLPEVEDEYDDDLVLEMLIDRSQLLKESFEYIAHAEPDTLRAGLFLEFKDEVATGPGVLREWFVLVCQAIFDPQYALFVACPNDRRRFFLNPASKVDPLHLEYFKFAGRVIALALIHKVQVGIVFDRVLFLQLAGRNISLEDIQDADPVLYISCMKIFEMDPEVVDQDALALTFTAETDYLGSRNCVELCPDGKNTAVTSKNRQNYVARLLRYRFVNSVAEQVAQFAQGFDDVINSEGRRISFFQCLELEDLDGLLYGTEKALCVEDWKAHTEYHGYQETDPQISWFWETVGSMSAGQRKVLLFFWTSLKYLPVEGFGGLSTRLFIYKVNETCNRLPSSQTCFYRLCFPPYQSLKVMQDRLSVITKEHVGCSFGTF